MDQHEMQCTHRDQDVLDTVAPGSMLVFASVMPPIGPDTAEDDLRRSRLGAAGADDLPGLHPDQTSALQGNRFEP
jgi:hypothetical protein